MILNSDLLLYHPLWERADAELCNKNALGIFNRLIDVYVLACSIGIKEDKALDPETPLDSPKSIARNTYMSPGNSDLKDLMDFLMQNAIINSKIIDFELDERIKLAFDPDYSVSKFSVATFLTGFANYGLQKMFEHIDSQASVVAIDELYSYFTELSESRYEEILKNLTLKEIDD